MKPLRIQIVFDSQAFKARDLGETLRLLPADARVVAMERFYHQDEVRIVIESSAFPDDCAVEPGRECKKILGWVNAQPGSRTYELKYAEDGRPFDWRSAHRDRKEARLLTDYSVGTKDMKTQMEFAAKVRNQVLAECAAQNAEFQRKQAAADAIEFRPEDGDFDSLKPHSFLDTETHTLTLPNGTTIDLSSKPVDVTDVRREVDGSITALVDTETHGLGKPCNCAYEGFKFHVNDCPNKGPCR